MYIALDFVMCTFFFLIGFLIGKAYERSKEEDVGVKKK